MFGKCIRFGLHSYVNNSAENQARRPSLSWFHANIDEFEEPGHVERVLHAIFLVITPRHDCCLRPSIFSFLSPLFPIKFIFFFNEIETERSSFVNGSKSKNSWKFSSVGHELRKRSLLWRNSYAMYNWI